MPGNNCHLSFKKHSPIEPLNGITPIYKMFVNLLFIYVNILTQSPPLNSERLYFKTPKLHFVP
jgi:hypothetical protein